MTRTTRTAPDRRYPARVVLAICAALAVAGVLLTAGPGSAATASSEVGRTAPSIRGAGTAAAIPDSYLVILGEDSLFAAVETVVGSVAAAYGVTVRRTFGTALTGFSTTMTADQAAAVARDPRVEFVQQNQRYDVSQQNPPWGLDRLDQRDLPLDGSFQAAGTNDGTDGGGGNVTVYVIDTGIYTGHADFGSRASAGVDTVGDGRGGADCNGHGSHVAGTIAGDTFGVAKNAKLVGVRVLDCEGAGSTESVVAGIEWVTRNARRPAVVNMSLGGPADEVMDAAVKASLARGISYAVAAGNEGADACALSPARIPAVLTVGATDSSDRAAAFSNLGRCVDVFAPGVDIESAGIEGPEAGASHSGTSMASPHVAGAVALFLAAHPHASPAAVTRAVLSRATAGTVREAGDDSPDRLLYVGAGD